MSRPAPPALSDGRLVLRPPTADDAAALTAACQDPEIQRWTAVPSPYTERDALEWIASTAGVWERGRDLELLVTDRSSGELLGAIRLVHTRDDRAIGEVGYWVAREARGRGVAADAAALVARWGLEHLGLARVQILAAADNEASQRVAERAGFTREGTLRSYVELKGERQTNVIFSLLPEDL